MIEDTSASSCDQEPVRYIHSVQPHTVLFGLSYPSLELIAVSANAVKFSPELLEENFGKKLPRVPLLAELSDIIFCSLEQMSWGSAFRIDTELECAGGGRWATHLFVSDDVLFCELEPVNAPAQNSPLIAVARNAVRSLSVPKHRDALGQLACNAIRTLTGMQRVCLYKFLPPGWHGEVVSEDKIASAQSFRGHRFPASDIPQPARELYLRNRSRFILDSQSGAVEIQPHLNPSTGRVFDLADSRCRAVAAVHLTYLRNMGVRSSFSIAVIVDEKLWGLFACHAAELTPVAPATRNLCEQVAEAFALVVPHVERTVEQEKQLGFSRDLLELLHSMRLSHDPIGQLLKNHRAIQAVFRCDGTAILEGNQLDFAGLTPPQEKIQILAQALVTHMRAQKLSVVACDCLVEFLPDWDSAWASGVLAVSAPEANDVLLMLLRREKITTILWGGDPRKTLNNRGYSGQINPRISFESWIETVRNRSLSWAAYEVEGVRSLSDFVLDAFVQKQRLIQEFSERVLARTPDL